MCPVKYFKTHTCELGVLGEEPLRTGSQQNHTVDDAAFRQQVDVGLRLRAASVHWGRCVPLRDRFQSKGLQD